MTLHDASIWNSMLVLPKKAIVKTSSVKCKNRLYVSSFIRHVHVSLIHSLTLTHTHNTWPMAGKRKQSQQTLDARASKKLDTTRNNLRNRLFARFGSLIHTIKGTLPSPDKGLVSLILRTFVKIKHGVDANLDERTRVVTVGLKTVLHDDAHTDRILNKLKAVSDFMSECRVNASLFANYVMLQCFKEDVPFPVRDKEFFNDCLKICGGSTGGCQMLKNHFSDFKAETGIDALKAEPGVDQVRGYEAERMATAAATFMQYHCSDRRNTIIKWHLRRSLRRNNLSSKVYKHRLYQLCEYIISPELSDEADIMQAVTAQMQYYGFNQQDFLNIEQMVSLITETCVDENWDDLKLIMTLQQLYLVEDRRLYDDVVNQAYFQFPGSDHDSSKSRSTYISQEWQFETPPRCMAALPFCKAQATFITVDKKAMQQMCKLQFDQGDIWWYQQFMNPFKKKAKIPCLRMKSGRVTSNETDLMNAMADENYNDIPWIVGPTFQTDGRQIKLQLLTAAVAHPGAPGLMNLHKEGYQVSFADQTLEDITDLKQGVYSLKHVHTDGGLEAFNDVMVIPVDPGDAVVVEGAHFPGTAVRKENVMNLMNSTHFERITFSGAEYRERTLATHNEVAEARRRTPTSFYGMALDSLKSERKRTCDLREFVSYCSTWNNVCNSIWNEVLTDHRRGHRFERFRAVQKTVEEIAEKIAPKADTGKRVVLFEDGKFLNICTGYYT